MGCAELTRLVTDYLEAKLTLRERLSFQWHLGYCWHCRRYLRQMKQSILLMKSTPQEPVPDAVRDELLARFRTWKAPK